MSDLKLRALRWEAPPELPNDPVARQVVFVYTDNKGHTVEERYPAMGESIARLLRQIQTCPKEQLPVVLQVPLMCDIPRLDDEFGAVDLNQAIVIGEKAADGWRRAGAKPEVTVTKRAKTKKKKKKKKAAKA